MPDKVKPWVKSLALAVAMAALPALASAGNACPLELQALAETVTDNGPVAFELDDASRGDYVLPSSGDMAALQAAIEAAIGADWGLFDAQSAGLGLAHCESVIGAETVDVVYEPTALLASSSRGLPMLALRRQRVPVPVLLSVPHAATEFRIDRQSAQVFMASRSVGLWVVAPQHRCHLAELAPADFQGTTSECGGSYRQSDAAHSQQSLFHAIHAAAWAAWPRSITLQIHGMGSAGFSASPGHTDPIVRHPNYPATYFHDRYAFELEALAYPAADLTSCAAYDGPRGSRVRELLCGTRNAQRGGLFDLDRLPQFIHLEQERPIREDVDSPAAMARAIDRIAAHVWQGGFEGSDGG